MSPTRSAGAPSGTPVALAARNLRLAFWISLAVAMVVTHWPRLRAGPVDSPIDKLAHATAYSLLMALACLAFPGTRRWALAGALMAVGAADELGQAIPWVNRSCELDDWLADSVGILVAWAFVAAAAPAPGGGVATLLDRRRTVAGALLVARPVNCLHLLTAAAVGALVGAPLAVAIDSFFVRKGPQPWQYGFIGGALGAAVAAHGIWEAGLRWRLRRAATERPCLACGTVADVARGTCTACARCGSARDPSDWAPVGLVRGDAELRACAVPVLLALAGLVVLSTASIALVATLRLRVEWVGAFDRWYRSRAADARILADLALVALLGAWALRESRHRIARLVDRCGSECLACGFDLRATSPVSAVGNCPECAAAFVRRPCPPQAPADAGPEGASAAPPAA